MFRNEYCFFQLRKNNIVLSRLKAMPFFRLFAINFFFVYLQTNNTTSDCNFQYLRDGKLKLP